MRTGFELAQNGVSRLDGPTLVARARLISVILQNGDDKSCAALSRGAPDTTELLASLEKIGPAFIAAYKVMTRKALVAEVNHVPPSNVTYRQVQQAVAE